MFNDKRFRNVLIFSNSQAKHFTRVLLVLIVAVLAYKTILKNLFRSNRPAKELESYESPEDFEYFDNERGTPSGKYIVPNIIHFLRWNKPFTFIEAVCLVAAIKNQNPDKVYIHTDEKMHGKYWDLVMKAPKVRDLIEFKFMKVPTSIFGQDLNPYWKYWHGGDIARIKVLMEYGGIFLDNDSFVVKSLDEFRKYETTLGWSEGVYMSNQGIIAHKNSRFLKKWLNSYRHHYWRWAWYYNTGERPTTTILEYEPHLIHRMKGLFCEEIPSRVLFYENVDSWRDHYIIHLWIRRRLGMGTLEKENTNDVKYAEQFDENNLIPYNCTLQAMVQSVYSLEKHEWHLF